MNFQILAEIAIFSGVAWYINSIYKFVEFNELVSNKFNKFNKLINDTTDYSKIFPTNNVDVDSIILSIVNKETLISLSTVSKYLADIITNKSFWRIRMEMRLELKTKNNDTNFRLITNMLDNNRSLSDNLHFYLFPNNKHFQQVYNILGENKKYGYLLKRVENKNLERVINAIYKNIFRPPHEAQYNFKEWKIFLKQTIELIGAKYIYSDFNKLTDIMKIKIIVNYQDNDECITIKCNKPSKLMILLFELSQRLQIKTIDISGIENNPDSLNLLFCKIIERLT